VCTVLVYLNDVEVGGCTYFRKLGLRIKPKAGMALVFFPAFMDAELDTNAIHCAEPAVDPKFVSQVWIRQFSRTDGQPSRRKDPVIVADPTGAGTGVAGVSAKQRLPIQVRNFGATAKLLNESSPFWTIDNFLSREECQGLITASEGLLDKSKTHAAPGGGVVASSERTSYTCHLDKKLAASQPFLQKVEKLTSKPQDHMELPQVARYTKDQRYLEHYDGIDPHTESGAAFCKNGGQRVCTVLVYLNDVEVGGCTYFRKLGLRVKPKAGMAIVFFPAYLDGELDTDLIHCAEPAVDQKWVAQVWIRQRTRVDGQPSRKIARRKPRIRRGCFDVEFGFIPAGSDMHTATMTIEEARAYCKSHSAIQGFTFQKAIVNPEEPLHIWFKSTSAVVLADGWTSYVKSDLDPLTFHVSSCMALKKVLLAKGWEEEDDGRPASFSFWQTRAGAGDHAATRLRLFDADNLEALSDPLHHARGLAQAGARSALLRSRFASLRDALGMRPMGGGTADAKASDVYWVLRMIPGAGADSDRGKAGSAGEEAVALAYKSLSEVEEALLALVDERKGDLHRVLGQPGELSKLLEQTASEVGAAPDVLERSFNSACAKQMREQVMSNAGGRYMIHTVPRDLTLFDGNLFTAHTYALAVSRVDRAPGGAPAASGDTIGTIAGAMLTPQTRTLMYMSNHSFLSTVPPTSSSAMSDKDGPLHIPLTARAGTVSSAVALPAWESWLPKMRASLKDALASYPLFMDTALPGDECTQYAVIECVWLFDKRGSPWLLGLQSVPDFYPTSGVDRYIKESLAKDIYTALIAPIVEDATPDMGQFVEL